MQTLKWTGLALGVSLCVLACGSDVETTGTTTTTGSGASGGSSSVATGGAASSGGFGGMGGSGGDNCHGDQTAWDALTKGDIPCQQNSDCCVVANQCTAESYMVHKDDQTAAAAAWPYCEPNDCANCVPQAVEIACVNNVCTGYVDINVFDPGTSHCGDDNVDPDPTGKDDGVRYFTCDGAI